jgi:hypothetical protein
VRIEWDGLDDPRDRLRQAAEALREAQARLRETAESIPLPSSQEFEEVLTARRPPRPTPAPPPAGAPVPAARPAAGLPPAAPGVPPVTAVLFGYIPDAANDNFTALTQDLTQQFEAANPQIPVQITINPNVDLYDLKPGGELNTLRA